MLNATSAQSSFLLARQSPTRRLLWVSLALAALLLAAIVVAVGSGSSDIAYSDVVRILLGTQDGSIPDSQITIVHQVRLPRVIAAVFIGAALAVSGAVMQGIFRNPLAESGILGVTVGGSLGAVIAFSTGTVDRERSLVSVPDNDDSSSKDIPNGSSSAFAVDPDESASLPFSAESITSSFPPSCTYCSNRSI